MARAKLEFLHKQNIRSPIYELLEASRGIETLLIAECERYLVIYLWQTLEGLISDVGMKINQHQRTIGLHQKNRGHSRENRKFNITYNFMRNEVCLFKAVPKPIDELTGLTIDFFTDQLDKWLVSVPDKPPTSNHPNITINSLASLHGCARKVELSGQWQFTSAVNHRGKILQNKISN